MFKLGINNWLFEQCRPYYMKIIFFYFKEGAMKLFLYPLYNISRRGNCAPQPSQFTFVVNNNLLSSLFCVQQIIIFYIFSVRSR